MKTDDTAHYDVQPPICCGLNNFALLFLCFQKSNSAIRKYWFVNLLLKTTGYGDETRGETNRGTVLAAKRLIILKINSIF